MSQSNGTAVDIPLRMFGPHYYDQACALMQDLGVSTQPVDFAASFWGPPPVPAGARAGAGARGARPGAGAGGRHPRAGPRARRPP